MSIAKDKLKSLDPSRVRIAPIEVTMGHQTFLARFESAVLSNGTLGFKFLDFEEVVLI